MPDLVLIDTCVWAAFFKKVGSPIKAEVVRLLDLDRVAIAGPIVAEVLLGIRSVRHADWVWSVLDGCHVLTPNLSDWRAAAALGRDLARRGRRLPLTDLLIAAIAQSRRCSVYTVDPDFDVIPDLVRHMHGN